MIDKYVLVTTGRRGVFFGKLAEDNGATVLIEEAQVCVYWSAATKGFLGLSAHGPQSGSKVSAPTPSLKLYDVTSISLCTDEAVEAWKAQPWL